LVGWSLTCLFSTNTAISETIALCQITYDNLLSLDTPTYTVAQIAERFEPNTVL